MPRQLPPRNPWLADSPYPLPHADSAQSDAGSAPGPIDSSRALRRDEIRYLHLGPGALGAMTSARYPDGRRVLWVNGVTGLYKIDETDYRILASIPSPLAARYSQRWAEAITARLDADTSVKGLRAFGEALQPLADLSGVYTLVAANGYFYVAAKDGTITAYGDADATDPASPIVVKARLLLPPQARGPSVGMNITADGWLIIATENGWLAAASADLKQARIVQLPFADREDTASRGPGQGWIRNSFAVDPAGGIYVASRNHMHKAVWTGARLSTDPADGAWTEPYRNNGGNGTGATPTLMGFGAEDHLVVLTDGDRRMNLTLFWRDAIPAGWATLRGAPSRRIAGLAPVDIGDPETGNSQSEQSVAVSGYGAFVVNNTPRNIPFYLPDSKAFGALSGGLGSNPKYQPLGVQKFEWDPARHRLFTAWVRRDVSSPNGVPWISRGSNLVYFTGARAGRWTTEAIDWTTGRPVFHYVLGGQKFNSTFSGVSIDDRGRIVFATMFGRVRLEPTPPPGRDQAPR